MKTYVLIFLCFSACLESYAGGKAPAFAFQKIELETARQSILYKHSAYAALPNGNDILKDNPQMREINSHIKTGIACTVIGGALTVAGPIMTGVGINYFVKSVNGNNQGPTVSGGIGAYLLVAFGIPATLAGIPLVIVGAVRWSKSVREKRAFIKSVEMSGSIKANGQPALTLRF